MTDILVVAEIHEGKPRKATLSAITFARQLAEKTSGAFDILVLGSQAGQAAAELTGYGARKVLGAELEGGYVVERYAPTVVEAAGKGYGVVTAAASVYGKDLLAYAAALRDMAYVNDISGWTEEGGKLLYERPIFAGNALAWTEALTEQAFVTVRQSEFEAAQAGSGQSPVETFGAAEPTESAGKVEFVGFEEVKSERPELTEAEVVVSGGRAFKSKENFEKLLEPLADLLGAAIGASRAACDAGYAPNDLQVGQTGKVVAPKLYIAIGISGAIQHLAGMKGSKVIVAINKNPEAPIAQVANYFLTADLFQAVPELIEELKKLKAA